MSNLNKCPCGNETENNLYCDSCIEESHPAYMVDENGKLMTTEEIFENSIDVSND